MDEEKERTNEGLVVIWVFQGCIDVVESNISLKVVILDSDTDGVPDNELTTIDGERFGIDIFDSGENRELLDKIKDRFGIRTERLHRAAYRALNEKIRSGEYEYLGGGMLKKKEKKEPSETDVVKPRLWRVCECIKCERKITVERRTSGIDLDFNVRVCCCDCFVDEEDTSDEGGD